MALDTYTNLQAEIAGFLNRQDLASEIPTFVRLAEAKFERNMRCREMVLRMYANTLVNPVTGALGDYLPLPADFLELKRAIVTNAPLPVDALEYATMDYIDDLNAINTTGGIPRAYNIVGQAMRLGPFPDKQYTIEVIYYAKLPRLAANNQVNWLLASHPDFYLYASLLQAAPYLKDDERIAVWDGIVGAAEGPNGGTGILGEIKLATERAEKSGSRIRTHIQRGYGSNYTYSNY
jgi:hypothetical protein